MQVLMHSPHVTLTNAVRAHIDNRIALALDRFRGHIMRISVRLSDANGPKGGKDKLCQVQLQLDGGLAAIVVVDQQSDLYAAIDRAVRRATAAVARSLQRNRQRNLAAVGRAHEISQA